MNYLKQLQIWFKNRGQPAIQRMEGTTRTSERSRFFFERSYDAIEVVRRGVDMIIDSAIEVDVNITNTLPTKPVHDGGRQRQKTLLTILNFRPNNNEDVNTFRRELVMDFLLTGNCYQYWDGTSLFYLPAKLMKIHTHDKNKVAYYEFEKDTKFYPDEIIHTRDNNAESQYEGRSRLYCTKSTISTLKTMLDFQENFFDNAAIPGLVIQTPNILSAKIKEKMLQVWRLRYNPKDGGRSPMILDGDLKVNPISNIKISELEFEKSIDSHEIKILKALGVPPVLLNSGNNANLRPNIQLFYEMTVLPLVSKLISSYERFFAYDMEPDVVKVRALRPELKEAGQYFTGLVNGGIMTPNEARIELRLEPIKDPEADELRVPANIAGSAADPSQGGAPPQEEEEEDESEEPSDEND
jgi:HK97 family phage portal protein